MSFGDVIKCHEVSFNTWCNLMTGHDLQKMPSGWRYCVTDITENTSIAKKGLSL